MRLLALLLASGLLLSGAAWADNDTRAIEPAVSMAPAQRQEVDVKVMGVSVS